jgi:hypothetical protein
MEDRLILTIETDAQNSIRAELGSMNAFHERLETLLAREFDNQARLSETAGEDIDGSNLRGGETVEIIGELAGIIAAVAPIVIAWIKSRSLEIEETIETRKSGMVVRKLRVRRGAVR